MTNKIDLISTPVAAIVASGLTHIDFADCYSGQSDRTYIDAEQAARAVFSNPPQIAQSLMTLRNRIMSRFGIKAGTDFRDHGLGKVEVFPIVSSSGTEIVLGGNDRHLDFRIWISIRPGVKGSEVSMSTLVKINNTLGRVYLFAIMPFHKMLSRMLLQRALLQSDSE